MDILEAIKARHSVRRFTGKKIEGEVKEALLRAIDECNEESGLNFQLCLNEPNAFKSRFFHYGTFKNCKDYIALIGPKGMDEKYGYYGQKVVLKAQQLGLNSCWVGLTYNKFKIPCIIGKGESIRLVIALGYGKTQGRARKSKDIMKLCKVDGDMPDWFKKGMEAATLAPTALNQQRFLMILNGTTVTAKALPAPYSKVDLGIVKYHFEIGAGKQNFNWG
ncbi:MAG: nitroreductase [Clostridiales bacterium]|nr:nitroreductase [Clostridiales bacterium]